MGVRTILPDQGWPPLSFALGGWRYLRIRTTALSRFLQTAPWNEKFPECANRSTPCRGRSSPDMPKCFGNPYFVGIWLVVGTTVFLTEVHLSYRIIHLLGCLLSGYLMVVTSVSPDVRSPPPIYPGRTYPFSSKPQDFRITSVACIITWLIMFDSTLSILSTRILVPSFPISYMF